jgi:methionine-rich copper-binding protein CopC
MTKRRVASSVRAVLSAHALVWISRRYLRLVTVSAAVVVIGSLMAVVPRASTAAASCDNPVACENELPGTPQSTWDMNSNEGGTIQGFADPFSVNVGDAINFKVQSLAASYVINIYRIGYYGGDGARLITTLTPDSSEISISQNQPTCNTNTTTGLVDCGNWGISATWDVPSTAVSGVYLADLVRTDGTTDMNQIVFVVTNNASTSDIVMMTNDETWEAYNDWGGYSFYAGDSTGEPWCCTSAIDAGRAVQISYNRPLTTRFDAVNAGGPTSFFADEYPMIRFLEENGYDVTYVSQADVGASGGAAMLEQHKMFLTAGHSEYWDAGDRANVTAARDAGVNLAFFTGNTMIWETRWAASQYGNEADRTLIDYKESWDNAETDPNDPPDWTGYWRDPRFSPPADGGQPENAVTGQLWEVDCCSYADTVPSYYSKLRIWQNTAVASLQSGQTYTMPPETLGYEWDVPVDNGFQPPGEIDLSQTCEDAPEVLLDIESDVGPGEACNSMTLYKASSGALVFDAGTVQWAWGLDSNHDGDSQNPPDPVMQQVTVNILADMGAQPDTLMSGLVPGTASTVTTPPTSTITSPSAGTTLASGSSVTISGTATDSSGGVVAGVEVSTDGGSTWHPVTTMSAPDTSVTWSYTWSVAGNGPVTILSRATDDSGNTETPGPGVSVTVNCPCSLFGDNYVPSETSANDSTAAELGMKFQSNVAGWVTGVRFYKGAGNDGTHTGSLWSATGTLLATGTFTNETSSGWQSMTFANPVEISANTTYVVSYYDPDGHYAFDQDLFDWALNAPPLTALKSDYIDAGEGNGVYNEGGPGFPTSSFEGSSYAVDVIFDTSAPPAAPSVTSVTPVAGSSSNPVSTAPSVTFSEPVVPSTVSVSVTDSSGDTVAGTTSLDSSDTVATFTPSSQLAAGTAYTVTVSGAQNSSGQTMTSDSYTFTTSEAFDVDGQCPCTVWPDVAPSGATDPDDPSPNNIGVEFQASENGTISGIRFYKEPDDTGTHTGTLWTSGGTELATGTFTDEPTQGWAELDFSSPVAVTAGTTYVASYQTQSGHYAFTSEGLSSPVTNGPLTAVAGVYAYGSSDTFPTNTYDDSNFWVDVVFNPSS